MLLTLHYCHSLHHIDITVPLSSSRFSSSSPFDFSSLGARWFQSFGLCGSAYSISKSLSWSWGLSAVRFRQLASRPTPLTEVRYSAPSQNPEKKASPLFNSFCYDIMFLWDYIIFRNNSSNRSGEKKIKKNCIEVIDTPHFVFST